jgi:trans-aconitate 2-methyltransferase
MCWGRSPPISISEEEKQHFEQLVLEGYTQAYPPQKDGRILFPFRRLFMVAYR